MTASVLLDMVAAVAALAAYNVAIALQALEARDMPEEHGLRPALLLKLLRRPRWLAGAASNFLGVADPDGGAAGTSIGRAHPTGGGLR